jgi:hypothetical protein
LNIGQYSGALIRNIGSVFRLPEPLQQRPAGTIFRDTNPQLVRTIPECSRHRLRKAFVPALHEAAIAKVTTGRFTPEPNWAKPIQLFPEFSNGRFAPLLR